MRVKTCQSLHFAVRASGDNQEENGPIWRRLQTVGISVRKRWSEIMLRKKDGRKRRLPKRAKQQREKLPGTERLQKWRESPWMNFQRRSKANPNGNVC